MSSSKQIDQLCIELVNEDSLKRRAAAIKLGRIRDEKAIPNLILCIQNDDDYLTRVSALQSLLWIAHPSIIDPIIDLVINDNNDLVRKTAIEALGNMKVNKSLPMLKSLQDNSSTSKNLLEIIKTTIEKLEN
ncbi:MAG: HEAT repeat domain-containing protein [Asgard group archaeon]|nr:HEAT repeat domain-containing protein [Asgard group archaeon]